MTERRQQLPVIAVSIGDPSGIGPEVVVKALSDADTASMARWLIVGDAFVLRWAENLTGRMLPSPPAADFVDVRALLPDEFQTGKLNPASGRAALKYVRIAVELCLRGRADAMVTGPVNKEAVTLSGENFTGHTEFIARMCNAADSRMLLVTDRLRVIHVSTHIGLRKACELDTERILRTIELGCQATRLLGVANPKIAVCGLNPHAGENGLFGDEDLHFIVPAVEAARLSGMNCEGPLPADSVFVRAVRGAYDLVVAMYHDQGHIPVKLLDFDNAVNVSLGLPIIRTSVDHGTAFDIAGRNLAHPGSMQAALRLAATMAAFRLQKP
jgi:4-hydroxythreonine-4-phosphate dehydrogenase